MTVYETIIDELARFGKSEKDVLWVGVPVGYGDEHRYDRVDLCKIFGFKEIVLGDKSNVPEFMTVAGGNWFLRYVGDVDYETGCTDFWWEYSEIPQMPTKIKEIGSCETPIVCKDFANNECAVVFLGTSPCTGCPHRDEVERKLSHEN